MATDKGTAPRKDGWKGSARPVEAYLEDASQLSPEEFEKRHGCVFLLLTATSLSKPGDTTSTRVELLDLSNVGNERTAGLDIRVFGVQWLEQTEGHLLTVGRGSNADVVIPDMSVSRFHAFIKRGANGAFEILDAGSTNGTTVNGVNVPTRGGGPAAQVKAGDTLRIGQLEFTFLEAAALQQYALKFNE
jgi:hypothetical protein